MRRLIEKKLQKIINYYLELDPESKNRLSTLASKALTIEFLNSSLAFQFIFSEDEVKLKTNEFILPNTVIRGMPLSLLHMFLRKKDRNLFFSQDISIEGDLGFGQKVMELFDEIEIDWEEYLSHWTGDLPAYQAGVLVKKIKRFRKTVRNVLTQNINEYIHEELNWFPPREEIDDFFNEVDQLRMDMDRIENRLENLNKELLK